MMTELLKLDFNERSDKDSLLAKDYAFGDSLWQYPDRLRLEAQIADLNGCLPEQVICTNGGDEAINLLMRIIKETGTLILPLPAFSQYTWGINSWKISADLIPSNSDHSIDLIATQQAISNTPKAVTIITRPNNPTGELITFDELEGLIQAAAKNDGWIFLDEAYIEFSQQAELSLTKLLKYDNLVILRTLSKAYGLAGIRLGYLIGNEKIIEKFKKRCMPFNISQPSLMIASQAFSTENQTEVDNYCLQIKQNREIIVAWLNTINIKVFNSQANFIFLDLPENQAQTIQSFLAKNGIAVKTFQDLELINCLRITIPFEIENLQQLLKQALQPQLICLDMDGVLIDTSGSYDATVKATVKKYSGKTVKQADINQLKYSGGFNNDWVLTQQLLKNLGVNRSLQEVTEVFQAFYLGENNDGFACNETPLINSSIIKLIQQTNQTRFAIVTGRPKIEANAGAKFLALHGIDIISLDDVKQPKPSPEGIKQLQSKYSNQSWMCGDNPDDMQAACASNSLAIGIGKNNQASLYQAGADIVLSNINELEKWLCPLK